MVLKTTSNKTKSSTTHDNGDQSSGGEHGQGVDPGSLGLFLARLGGELLALEIEDHHGGEEVDQGGLAGAETVAADRGLREKDGQCQARAT